MCVWVGVGGLVDRAMLHAQLDVLPVVGGVLLLLVLDEALVEAPLAHHEGVVDREAVDGVDAELLHLAVGLLVAGQVGGGAGRREGARQGEDGHALALEVLLGRHVLPAFGFEFGLGLGSYG